MRKLGLSRSNDRKNRKRRKMHTRTPIVPTADPVRPREPQGEFYDGVNMWWTRE